jgi:cytidyltransferase-like protein
MNFDQLTESILNEQPTRKIGIFPGAFKPPHKGHFEMVSRASQENDEVYLFISPKEREGITADEALAIWNEYATLIPGFHVKIAEREIDPDTGETVLQTPVAHAYNLIERVNRSEDATNIIVTVYAGTQEDFDKRFGYLFNNPEKYGNIGKLQGGDASTPIPSTPELAKYGHDKLSASAMRQALAEGDKEAFLSGLPDNIDKEKVWRIVG